MSLNGSGTIPDDDIEETKRECLADIAKGLRISFPASVTSDEIAKLIQESGYK